MTVLIVLAVLIGIGLILAFSYRRASERLTAQLEKNYSTVADKYAQELTAWVNTNATIIDTLASEISTGEIYLEDYETFHEYLAANYAYLNKDETIFDLYFTYPDNTMACASDFVSDGTIDYAHERDWFTAAAGTGELFYSTPYLDSDSGKPVITISKAVYKDNKLQGVFAADIFVDVLVDIISKAEVAQNSYAFLVDSNLCMVVHPNEAYAFDDVPHGVMDVPGAPYGDVISKIRSGSNETVYLVDYDGVTRGVAVSEMKNTGWFVGIATSKTELMRGMDSLGQGYLIAAAIALVIVGGVAFFITFALGKARGEMPSKEEKVRVREKKQEEKKEKAKKRPSDAAREFRIAPLVPVLVIFLLMAVMVIYTSRAISSVSAANIREVGEDRISASAAQLENYLEMNRSSLWVTADTVDHMVRSGGTTEEIHNYIVEETENQSSHFDENITGFYAYVKGEYLDGLNWTPPENYDPTKRDWYLNALEGNGEAVIIPPYVDAQTKDVIISICRMLSSGTDVVSVDVRMNHIQDIVSDLQIKGKGYGFIIDGDGLIIAHRDDGKKGDFMTETESQLALMDKIIAVGNGNFEITTDGQRNNVFVRKILDQWYVVIVISNQELLLEVRQQIAVNVLICVVIFLLIATSYYFGQRREKKYSRRIEEMRAEEQKQAYEAKALKLEKEAADRANEAKSSFLAEMSHEIRTPINAVLGMNEMIVREIDDARESSVLGEREAQTFDNIGGYAANIESAGGSLLSVINDILDFSKIESGKLEIVEAEYKLSSLLNDVSNMIFFRAKEKGLDFSVSVDGSIPDHLCGDAVRIRQVIINLLTNAVKYTETGSVRMTVAGKEEKDAENGDRILLSVSVTDTGIGIREDDIEKLFRKFQRVDMEHNSTVEGTGLGLAITHSLVEKMGGQIGVKSVYGSGSTFTARFPQRIVSREPVGDFRERFENSKRVSRKRRASFRAPEARILIVDDTQMNLSVAVGLLKKTEIRIDTATSGPQAIGLAASERYDLILMDQRMPGMDGAEALNRIRALEGGVGADVPVICLTADAVIGAKEKYLAEGFDDYLSKPIDVGALEEIIKKYLPQDKLIAESGDAVPDGDGETADEAVGFDRLREAGVFSETGLSYCRGDAELYRSVLADYSVSAAEKEENLGKYFDAMDFRNYGIYVHSLKSTSRTIGAEELSDLAAELEAAAEREDADTIRNKHGEMMRLYRRVTEALTEFAAGEGDADDGEIFEFPAE